MNLLKRASILLVASIAFAATCTERIVEPLARAIEDFVDFLLSAFKPDSLRLAPDGPDLVRSESRPSLAAALLESLRHEKGVSHLRAARGI